MKEFVYLILGSIIGGTIVLFIMCSLQINRINDYENMHSLENRKH